jgi:hypothetical protein
VSVHVCLCGADTLFGSHYDEYVIDYQFYVPDNSLFNATTFAKPAMSCGAMQGAGYDSPAFTITSLFPSTTTDAHFDEYTNNHGKAYGCVRVASTLCAPPLSLPPPPTKNKTPAPFPSRFPAGSVARVLKVLSAALVRRYLGPDLGPARAGRPKLTSASSTSSRTRGLCTCPTACTVPRVPP